MIDLVISYNPAQGFEDVALAPTRRLFAQYNEEIDVLTLSPVPDEDFALYLNDTLLRSHERSGRSPLVADVKAALARAGTAPDPLRWVPLPHAGGL